MRKSGKTALLPLEEAQHIVLDRVEFLASENIALPNSLGRILAEAIVAKDDIPAGAASSMDGYAVVAEKTRGASSTSSVVISVVEEIRAGSVPQRRIVKGTAARIMTGALIPPGADAVVMVESTHLRDGAVEVMAEVKQGENVRARGEVAVKGEVVLPDGTPIGPAQLGMAAALGRERICVARRPEVSIVTTGDELIDGNQQLCPGMIRDSNRYTLMGQLLGCGAKVRGHRWVGDDPSMLRKALIEASSADVIITSGGVSMGKYDNVRDAVSAVGRVIFWRIAIKPGKPTLFGEIGQTPIFALPGNPVSAMVVFEILVRPALLKMAGCRYLFRPVVEVRILEDLDHECGRREFVRARTTLQNGQWVARPTGPQGSGVLTSMCLANSLLIVPEEVESVARGDVLSAVLLDAFLFGEKTGSTSSPYGAKHV